MSHPANGVWSQAPHFSEWSPSACAIRFRRANKVKSADPKAPPAFGAHVHAVLAVRSSLMYRENEHQAQLTRRLSRPH
jgi:hypothetical protein